MNDVVELSAALTNSEVLQDPADKPAVFTCKYDGQESTGFVARLGVVFIVPDRVTPAFRGPVVFTNVAAMRKAENVTDVDFDAWEVLSQDELITAGGRNAVQGEPKDQG